MKSQHPPGCAVTVIQDGRDRSHSESPKSVSEDSEHMAGWTVEYESGVGIVLEFIEPTDRTIGDDIPQMIECRLSTSTLFPHSDVHYLYRNKAMENEGRSSNESGRRLSEPPSRDMPSPRDSPRRYRAESPDVDDLVDLRLSLAGLQPGVSLSRQSSKRSSSHDDELLDELHSSDPYSSVIEKLRLQLGECLPAIDEEMISKAVIHAFSTDPKSGKTEPALDKFQIEVELLCEAQKWVHQHLQGRDERAQQDFLQECLNKVFLQIHLEQLSSCQRALRIIMSIAIILGLDIDGSVSVPHDTVILQGLPRITTRESLSQALKKYGSVNSIALSTKNLGFAYCRFREEASATRVVANRNSVAIGGSLVRATLLGESSVFYHHQNAPESPARKLAGADEEELEISPVCVSKNTGSSFVVGSSNTSRKSPKHHRRKSSFAAVPFLS